MERKEVSHETANIYGHVKSQACVCLVFCSSFNCKNSLMGHYYFSILIFCPEPLAWITSLSDFYIIFVLLFAMDNLLDSITFLFSWL